MKDSLAILNAILSGLTIPLFLLVLNAAVKLEHRLTRVETTLENCFGKELKREDLRI